MKLFRKIKAEFTNEDAELPPDELLRKAAAEEEKPELVLARDYVSATRELREKGFGWSEIVQWYKSKGVPFSLATIRRVYRIQYESPACPTGTVHPTEKPLLQEGTPERNKQ